VTVEPESSTHELHAISTTAEMIAEAADASILPPGAFTLSDSGNAKRFVLQYGHIVRYAADSKMWYTWEGSRWRPDIGGLRVLALTLGVANYIRLVEAGIDGVDIHQLGQHALRSESESGRQKMLRLAASDPRITVREADLDANDRLLVVRNGTLDLKTGLLRESRPEDLCTRQAAVAYDPQAECPLWLEHVKLVTDGDPVLGAYLQRACGYTLTGLIGEQKFFFLWGEGQNGKNVFVETVLGLLGEYGAVAPTGLLTGGSGQHPTVLADLRGARMVMADETGHDRINEARLKMLTGSARVKARFMGKDFFEYDSTMKLWVLGNAKPAIKDQTEGTWRRMQLVPFVVRIPDDRKRSDFVEVLEAEWAGILNWCLDGLRGWLDIEGLGTPEVVTRAVATYREEEDEIGQWLADCCSPCDPEAEDGFTLTSTLYMSYRQWCEDNGLRVQEILKKVMWGRALTGRPYGTGKIGDSVPTRLDGKTVRVRHGIKLTAGSFMGYPLKG
jgi:putative DNA primase/helicase